LNLWGKPAPATCRGHSCRRFGSVTDLPSLAWVFEAAVPLPPSAAFPPSLRVILHPQLPRRPQCAGEHILARSSQPDMRVSHAPEPARNRQEDIRRLFHECCLLLRCKRQITVPRGLRGQRSKSRAAHPESRQSRVLNFLHTFQAQRNPSKIGWCHSTTPTLTSSTAPTAASAKPTAASTSASSRWPGPATNLKAYC